ncbi:MAG: rod shape-determining protein MreC [Anaerolineales bacterium]|jgi:rod shape-determining protein MreC|nr:rod shape-determining protein MreC [Anaerolineales bacterium]
MKLTTSRTLQTIVLAAVVIGLILLALGGYLTPVSRIVLGPVVSAQTWFSTRFAAIQEYFQSPQDMNRMRLENAALEAEVARLQAEIISLKQQIGETQVLSALVDFARVNPEYRYVAASVIGRDPSPFLQYVIINRGSDDGLRRGMPVVTQQGLVGRVAAVTAGAARLQLITDPSSKINVRLEPSRASAVLQGEITGDVSLDMIPQLVAVQTGDLVLTSGLGGNYPPNILVGQVTGVRSLDTDLFQRASVQPVVDFNQLEIVLVITNFRSVDIAPLVPTASAP